MNPLERLAVLVEVSDSDSEVAESHFKRLQAARKPLSAAERTEVMKAKAVWHHGPHGEETPAVWKAVLNGRTYYLSNTHRMYAKRNSVAAAIKAFHASVKHTR